MDDYIPLIIKYIGNMAHPFPSGARARKVLFHKAIDLVYLLSTRMKYDQIQQSMSIVFKLLFELFTKTFITNENSELTYRNISFDVIVPTKGKLIQYLLS